MQDVPIRTIWARKTSRNTVDDVIRRLDAARQATPNLIVYPDEQNHCLVLVNPEIGKIVSEILLD